MTCVEELKSFKFSIYAQWYLSVVFFGCSLPNQGGVDLHHPYFSRSLQIRVLTTSSVLIAIGISNIFSILNPVLIIFAIIALYVSSFDQMC